MSPGTFPGINSAPSRDRSCVRNRDVFIYINSLLSASDSKENKSKFHNRVGVGRRVGSSGLLLEIARIASSLPWPLAGLPKHWED